MLSTEAINWAWGQDTSPTEMLVLVCLADFANEEKGFIAWPGRDLIAKKTKLYPTTVSKVICRLEAKKLVKVKRRKRAGVQRINLYTLPVGAPEAPTGCSKSTYRVLHEHTNKEPLIEPLEEPLVFGSAKIGEPSMAKGFGEKDVKEALSSVVKPSEDNLTDILKKLKESSTPYPPASLRRLYVYLHWQNGFGFLAPWTAKELGQIKGFQEKLGEDYDTVPVLIAVLSNWQEFTQYTEAFSRPTKPHVGFLYKYAGEAVNFADSVQSVAQKPKKLKGMWVD